MPHLHDWRATKKASATEEELKDLGFGYRAKYIVGSAKMVQSKGGAVWLDSLRECSRDEAKTQLVSLPGVGPKVADCISLFSLDHLDVVPVDTHVWQMANKYMTTLGKHNTPTPRVFNQINDFFIEKFGDKAGWAHTILFSAAITKGEPEEETRVSKSPKKKREPKEDPEYIPEAKKPSKAL